MSFFYVTYNKSVSFPENSFIDVSPGETLSSVIIKLKSQYSFEKSFEVKFVMKALSVEDNITIGRHDLSKITKVKNLVKNLTSPTIQASITLLEGWSINDIVKYLSNHKDLKMFNKDNFKKRCYDVNFINKELGEKIGYNNIVSLEGFLFPETYSVDSYLDEEELLKIFRNRWKSIEIHENQ